MMPVASASRSIAAKPGSGGREMVSSPVKSLSAMDDDWGRERFAIFLKT